MNDISEVKSGVFKYSAQGKEAEASARAAAGGAGVHAAQLGSRDTALSAPSVTPMVSRFLPTQTPNPPPAWARCSYPGSDSYRPISEADSVFMTNG